MKREGARNRGTAHGLPVSQSLLSEDLIISDAITPRQTGNEQGGSRCPDAHGSLIAPHPVCLALGASGAERHRHYRHLFDAHPDEQASGIKGSVTNENHLSPTPFFFENMRKLA